MTLVLVGVAIALAAVVQSASGFGFSLLAVPILSVVVGARAAVVGTSLVAPMLTFTLAAAGRRHIRVATVVIVSVAAVTGMPIGLWVLTHVPDRVLAASIAVVVIVLTSTVIRGVHVRSSRGLEIAAGLTSGVLATSTGTNGPPLVLALQAARVPSVEFRATLSAAFVFQGLLAVVGFALAGAVTVDALAVAAAGLPGLLVGRLVGDRIFSILDERRFRLVVLTLLLAAAAFSLVASLTGGV